MNIRQLNSLLELVKCHHCDGHGIYINRFKNSNRCSYCGGTGFYFRPRIIETLFTKSEERYNESKTT